MKTVFCAVLLCISFYSFSQAAVIASKDTLIQTDGTKYVGTITKTIINEDNTSEVEFVTEDGQKHNVPSSSIAQIKRAHPAIDVKSPATETKASAANNPDAQKQSDFSWSNPAIPERIVRKHRTGIALTVLGSVFTIAGVAMLAGGITANGQTSSYVGNGGAHASVNVGVTGIIGALMTIAGVPMLISGGVKLGRSKKMARAALLYLH